MEKLDSEGSPGNFITKIRALPREELIMVLRRRRQYQPEAAAEAVKEALRRGIIRQEEDLNSPEFDEPVSKFTFFPCPESEKGKDKLFRSLLRVVMIVGAIPVIYGVMKLLVLKYAEGAGLVSLGVVWAAMAWLIMERHEKRLLMPMFILALLSVIYAVRILYFCKYLKLIDVLVPVVLYGVIFYFLLFILSLFRKKECAWSKG